MSAELSLFLSAAGEVGKIAIGGVVASVVTLIVTGRRQDRDLERAACHLATRLVETFERYAVGCAEARSFHQNAVAEDPYDWSTVARLPDQPELPEDDLGWRAIEARFAIFARTFGMRIERAHGSIRWESDQGDVDDVAYEVERQAALLGIEAINYAGELRQRYGFSSADLGWDVAGHLESEKARIQRRDAAREEANRQMWADLESSTTTAANTAEPPA